MVQAPEHVIENHRALAKAGDDPKARRRVQRKPAPAGFVSWTEEQFERLVAAPPEPLQSRMQVSHAMVLNIIEAPGDPVRAMRALLTDNHEDRRRQVRLQLRAIEIYRSLVVAGIVEKRPEPDPTGRTVPALDSTDCNKLWRLRGEVCNRGASPAAAPIFATFYEGHPERGGKVLCTGQTTVPTAPGACQPITCDLLNPPTRSIDLYLRVGDDGKGSRLSSQCKDKNDLAHQPAATCSSIPG